ncbi:oxygen-independent coproporphyrinogen III oxidase [Chitinophaga horti]|uniref:Coproporphyrinogen-III oxidase n=1 Tax=Chitinophaga horti TaxID=2920382 RepID=A0ABY6IZQ4_9BACT|nr:oxygen-independent coproporphyrinogen III oxidase [Chitinophaga horti]UYQ92855.1 oxygen-independent coproporphyrinogen III oxidase [Chitinophaga horti]
MDQLLRKYNVPVPRYTSYPTVPFWKEKTSASWQNHLQQQFSADNLRNGIALYMHLPFCETLCTYCGCNKKITKRHSVEPEYMAALQKEWDLYTTLMPEKAVLRELHLGGGTPTFFSPEHLADILLPIFKDVDIADDHAFSFEGHPANTTTAHLKMLKSLGFTRVSYGVQDNDEKVQEAINRIQPWSDVVKVVREAREIGYKSVNIDLVYGLPFQTAESMRATVNKVLDLRPDRIAFYSYAHIPWKSCSQRLYSEADLPGAAEKLELYNIGRELFTAAGYADIGMDHFALPHDDLYTAWQNKELHRNFMGYTHTRTNMLIGLGVSSISDTGSGYAQNQKELRTYYQELEKGVLPTIKGYYLDKTDKIFRRHILDIACNGSTLFHVEQQALYEKYAMPILQELAQDGLVEVNLIGVKVTETGKRFIRNVCRAFDLKVLQAQSSELRPQLFSKAI